MMWYDCFDIDILYVCVTAAKEKTVDALTSTINRTRPTVASTTAGASSSDSCSPSASVVAGAGSNGGSSSAVDAGTHMWADDGDSAEQGKIKLRKLNNNSLITEC